MALEIPGLPAPPLALPALLRPALLRPALRRPALLLPRPAPVLSELRAILRGAPLALRLRGAPLDAALLDPPVALKRVGEDEQADGEARRVLRRSLAVCAGRSALPREDLRLTLRGAPG